MGGRGSRAEAGVVAIVPVISPYREARDRARAAHHERGIPFIEVFVDTPIEVCEERDPPEKLRLHQPRQAQPSKARTMPAWVYGSP